MAEMLAFLNQIVSTLEGVFIPGLAPCRDRLQVFDTKLLLTILEIEEDFPYSLHRPRTMNMTWKDLLRGLPERENLSNNFRRSASYESGEESP